MVARLRGVEKAWATPSANAASGHMPLVLRMHDASYAAASTATSADTVASVERVAPGGLDLLPIPGRYLSAPIEDSAVRIRLDGGAGQTTARCAAPQWQRTLRLASRGGTGTKTCPRSNG